eukprot:2828385-Prymnesium_polylepis.2
MCRAAVRVCAAAPGEVHTRLAGPARHTAAVQEHAKRCAKVRPPVADRSACGRVSRGRITISHAPTTLAVSHARRGSRVLSRP